MITGVIKDGQISIDFYPRILVLCTNLNCNTRCVYCDQLERVGNGNLKPGRDYLDNVSPLLDSANHITIIGGETFALSDDELDDIFGRIDQEKHISVTTNAIGLTADRYKRWVADGPIKSLHISLNTITAKEYRNGRSDKVLWAKDRIREIAALNQNHKIERIQCVINKIAIDMMVDIVELAAECRVKSVCLSHVSGYMMGKHDLGNENPFGAGYSDEIAKRILDNLAEAERVGKRLGVNVNGHTIRMRLSKVAESKRVGGEK